MTLSDKEAVQRSVSLHVIRSLLKQTLCAQKHSSSCRQRQRFNLVGLFGGLLEREVGLRIPKAAR